MILLSHCFLKLRLMKYLTDYPTMFLPGHSFQQILVCVTQWELWWASSDSDDIFITKGQIFRRGQGLCFKKKALWVSTLWQPLLWQMSGPASSCQCYLQSAWGKGSSLGRSPRLFPESSAPARQLSHTATTMSLLDFQPRPVVTVTVHFCCSHLHCQGKLGLANPCHYCCRKKDHMLK